MDVRDINGNFKKIQKYNHFFLEKYAFKKSTHILVTTEKQKIIIEKKYKISSEKIFIIENGVDLEQIKLNPKKTKKIRSGFPWLNKSGKRPRKII